MRLATGACQKYEQQTVDNLVLSIISHHPNYLSSADTYCRVHRMIRTGVHAINDAR